MVPIIPETGNFRNDFPERYSGTFRNSVTIRNSGTTFRKFPFYGKKIVPEIVPEFRFSGTFSIMEMEKISRSFPYVNRNPEFRWKPYTQYMYAVTLQGRTVQSKSQCALELPVVFRIFSETMRFKSFLLLYYCLGENKLFDIFSCYLKI